MKRVIAVIAVALGGTGVAFGVPELLRLAEWGKSGAGDPVALLLAVPFAVFFWPVVTGVAGGLLLDGYAGGIVCVAAAVFAESVRLVGEYLLYGVLPGYLGLVGLGIAAVLALGSYIPTALCKQVVRNQSARRCRAP